MFDGIPTEPNVNVKFEGLKVLLTYIREQPEDIFKHILSSMWFNDLVNNCITFNSLKLFSMLEKLLVVLVQREFDSINKMLVELLQRFLNTSLKKYKKNKFIETLLRVVEYWFDSGLMARIQDVGNCRAVLSICKTAADLLNFYEHRNVFIRLLGHV